MSSEGIRQCSIPFRFVRTSLQIFTVLLALLYLWETFTNHAPTQKDISANKNFKRDTNKQPLFMNVSHSHKATAKPVTKISDSYFNVFIEETIDKAKLGTNQRKPEGKDKLHHASEIKDEEYEEYDEDEYEEMHEFQEKPRHEGKCERKIDLVYIKTHKTGSCTVTNMLYRNALIYNISTLLFTCFPYPTYNISKNALNYNIDTLLFTQIPYPWSNITSWFLHKHTWLWTDHNQTIPSKFHLAADHMRYERSEFDKVMLGTPLYTTTLRHPLDHLRSMFNYFGLAKKIGINQSYPDPVAEFIRNDKYPKHKMRGVNRVDNRNADMFGFPEEYMNNPEDIERFLKKMTNEFGLVMITEYMSESFVLLRRKMCWDLADVLYTSINVRKYRYKTEPDPELVQLHKDFNMVDYIMYDHFNNTLWKDIEKEGKDFWDEMDVYEKYQEMSGDYCELVYKQMKRNISSIYHLHKTMKPLILPETKWGPEAKIDPVWCLVSRIDIMPFYNILRVKQYPQICDHLVPLREGNSYTFRMDKKRKTFEMLPQYCAKNPENLLAPLDLLATKGKYMWS